VLDSKNGWFVGLRPFHGNANVLTLDHGTSRLGQGPTSATCWSRSNVGLNRRLRCAPLCRYFGGRLAALDQRSEIEAGRTALLKSPDVVGRFDGTGLDCR
jgi:hypothetical protein